MVGYLALVGWTTNIALGLRMHGIRRLPVGVVLPHAAFALTGYFAWIYYLVADRPQALGWFAVVWLLAVNGFGDLAVVRRWKKKSDGGSGLVGTYLKRIKARRILQIHLVTAGVTTVLAFLAVLGY